MTNSHATHGSGLLSRRTPNDGLVVDDILDGDVEVTDFMKHNSLDSPSDDNASFIEKTSSQTPSPPQRRLKPLQHKTCVRSATPLSQQTIHMNGNKVK